MRDYLRIFSNSLARMEDIGPDKGELIERFYEKFLRSSPEAVEKFANTEMENQRQMLRDSFKHVLTFSTRRRSTEEFERIARRHRRGDLDISPVLYEAWLDALLAAVEELDPEFDSSVRVAWRIVMAPGIEFMKGHYEDEAS